MSQDVGLFVLPWWQTKERKMNIVVISSRPDRSDLIEGYFDERQEAMDFVDKKRNQDREDQEPLQEYHIFEQFASMELRWK